MGVVVINIRDCDMRITNKTWLHIYLTIAAVSLAVITTYYPSSISLMLSLFKIV
jgi:hypothetical protein